MTDREAVAAGTKALEDASRAAGNHAIRAFEWLSEAEGEGLHTPRMMLIASIAHSLLAMCAQSRAEELAEALSGVEAAGYPSLREVDHATD